MNKNFISFLGLTLLTSLSQSCGVKEQEVSNLNFKELHSIPSYLHQESIRICVTGGSDAEFQRISASVERAFRDWISPLQRFADKFPKTINASHNNCSGELMVNVDPATTRAFVRGSGANNYTMHLNGNSNDATILHEMGHIMGLHDTYIEGVWTCQPGQPESMMCDYNKNMKHLGLDDIAGIQKLYCAGYSCSDYISLEDSFKMVDSTYGTYGFALVGHERVHWAMHGILVGPGKWNWDAHADIVRRLFAKCGDDIGGDLNHWTHHSFNVPAATFMADVQRDWRCTN